MVSALYPGSPRLGHVLFNSETFYRVLIDCLELDDLDCRGKTKANGCPAVVSKITDTKKTRIIYFSDRPCGISRNSVWLLLERLQEG